MLSLFQVLVDLIDRGGRTSKFIVKTNLGLLNRAQTILYNSELNLTSTEPIHLIINQTELRTFELNLADLQSFELNSTILQSFVPNLGPQTELIRLTTSNGPISESLIPLKFTDTDSSLKHVHC